MRKSYSVNQLIIDRNIADKTIPKDKLLPDFMYSTQIFPIRKQLKN